MVAKNYSQIGESMKKMMAGVSLLGVLFLTIGCSGLMGEKFRSMTLKHGVKNGKGIMATERFVLLFEGVDQKNGGGSRSITYAGRHGSVPRFWDGYCGGWGGDETGITSYNTYEPRRGTAILYQFGKLILIEDSGRTLRVQNGRFALEEGKIVVVSVGVNGLCKGLSDSEAKKVYEGLNKWYKDGEISAFPLRMLIGKPSGSEKSETAPLATRAKADTP
jgi:hypothetical protein